MPATTKSNENNRFMEHGRVGRLREARTRMAMNPTHIWAVFSAVITIALLVDLSFFHRKAHEVNLKEALLGCAGWIGLALLFNAFVFFVRGRQAGLEFMTGYVVEQSLSVDNVFAFLIILQAFRVPSRSHYRVLFYGV